MNGKFSILILTGSLCVSPHIAAAQSPPASSNRSYPSHPPMRPLPQPVKRTIANGPKRFVDAKRGNDAAAGTEQAPWRTLQHAARQLRPGDTLYLREGTYFEHVALPQSGTSEAPITICS